MTDLTVAVSDAGPLAHAAAPTLRLRLAVGETTGVRVAAIALACQLRIEPARRSYTPAEEARLVEVFDEPSRWGQTLKPMQLAMASVMVPGFTGSCEVDVDVACTYDLEVATGKYFHALEGGEVPLLLLFSGPIFVRRGDAIQVGRVSWSTETRYGLPVERYREMMDAYFPGSGWLRLSRSTLDELQRVKVSRGLLTWEQAVERLLKEAGEG